MHHFLSFAKVSLAHRHLIDRQSIAASRTLDRVASAARTAVTSFSSQGGDKAASALTHIHALLRLLPVPCALVVLVSV